MCWIFERNMKKGGTSWKDVPHGLFYKASPRYCQHKADDYISNGDLSAEDAS